MDNICSSFYGDFNYSAFQIQIPSTSIPPIDPLISCIMQRFLTNQELDIDGRDSNEGVDNTSEL